MNRLTPEREAEIAVGPPGGDVFSECGTTAYENAAFILDWSKIPGGPPPEHLVLKEMRKLRIAVPGDQAELFDASPAVERAA